jgi:hypothetical protein
MVQERQRAMAQLFVGIGYRDLSRVRLLEVGCGTGKNLLELLRFGFKPEMLQGIELLMDSAKEAVEILPSSLRIVCGDATCISTSSIYPGSQDIVYQSTVFSSLLDDDFQQRLAERMWSWTRPGGGIMWYDFTVNNPRNRDVRGVSLRRVQQLFPLGKLRARRVTLAPPIARAATRVHPKLYAAFNSCPWLRTHVLAWIQKPA